MSKSYLVFNEVPPNKSRKTKTFVVYSAMSSAFLGSIKWYSAWRRYAFYPGSECVFDAACLREITAKLDELMAERQVTPVEEPKHTAQGVAESLAKGFYDNRQFTGQR